MNRRDWHLPLRFHIIRRTCTDQQTGILLWGYHRQHTLDIWIGHTLWTIHRTDA